MATFLFPSKTFLLGEYAVLKDGRALLLAHEPFFRANFAPSNAKPAFAAESAAGKLASVLDVDLQRLAFSDPHAGRGGFGGSGAEFLSVLAAKKKSAGGEAFAWEAWDLYRQLGCSGSGADILTQGAATENSLVALDLANRHLELLPPGKLGLHLTLFHTGRKLPTHEHLKGKASPPIAPLTKIVDQGITAYRHGRKADFLAAITAYAKELAQMGLVAEHSAQALAEVQEMGILAAKGCGAMGADVLLLCSAEKTSLGSWAHRHSLVEVASLPI